MYSTNLLKCFNTERHSDVRSIQTVTDFATLELIFTRRFKIYKLLRKFKRSRSSLLLSVNK